MVNAPVTDTCPACHTKYGEHKVVLDLTKKKDKCQWCRLDISHTDEEYEEKGNICSNCSGRADRVEKEFITPEEADKELLIKRTLNR